MILRRGDINDLLGNVVVYWDVDGENSLSPGDEIIGANFTISAIPFENKMLTATFPPVSFKDMETLMGHLINIKCDIIYGGEIKLPKNEKDFQKFYKQEFVKFNKIVEKYTIKYKCKFSHNYAQFSEKEQIHLLAEYTQKIRKQLNTKHIEKSSKKELISLVRCIKSNYQKYDVASFMKAIFKQGKEFDKLSSLYAKKYLAIYYEEYERAMALQEQIVNTNINTKPLE